ncbi:MAG: acetyl-CoA carboxylase biotin carboxyl carrier protein subunit [bacterium]
MKKNLIINGSEVEVELIKSDSTGVMFRYAGKEWSFNHAGDNALFETTTNGSTKRHNVFKHKHGTLTFAAIGTRTFKVEDAVVSQSKGAAVSGGMVSPMPGKILKLFKKINDSVKAGETILVMEAMKMEHAIKAPKDGAIIRLDFREGDQVDGGVVLVELKENS